MRKGLIALAIAVVVIFVVASQSFFVVRENEQVIVLQFGDPQRVVREPGLEFLIPFLQNAQYFDRRILPVDPPVEQVTFEDNRRLDVDSFVRYRITDPLRFFQAVRDEEGAAQQISRITNSSLRGLLGNRTQIEILSEQRADIMASILEAVEAQTEEQFGIDIIDVRIGRADVPEGTVQSVYNRMRSEREREAAEFRAQGEELSQQIRSRADRERTVLLAEAQREAEILRGQGDGQAITILADAYSADEDFFAFYRSLQAYRQSLGSGTHFVMSPTGDFFRFFRNVSGAGIEAGSLPSLPVPGGVTGDGTGGAAAGGNGTADQQ